MRKLIGIIIAAVTWTACNNKEPKVANQEVKQEQTDPKQEFAKLNALVQKFEEPSQIFKAHTDKRIKVTGKHGTIIHINPVDLETESGQPLGKDVQIELKELTNKEQLLTANAQTVSDGELLVSGGAYYINATSDGQQLKLKKGKSYLAEFPQLSGDTMSLYYGERDNSNQMNWKKTEQKFQTKAPKHESPAQYEAVIVADGMRNPDTARIPMKATTKEEIKKMEEKMKRETEESERKAEQERKKMEQEATLNQKVYNPIAMTQFGWINCDHPMPIYAKGGHRTKVQFTISNSAEEVNNANIYLVFKDLKSVLQATYYSNNNNIEKQDFHYVPIDMTVRFLAVCYQHEKIFVTLTDNIKVTKDYNEKLMLTQVNEAEFEKLIKSMD